MNQSSPIPDDWGEDHLGDFINAAHQNTIATFAKCRPQYDRLSGIDRLYRQMTDNLTNSPEILAGFLLIRTYSCFLASVRLALSGQVAETYLTLRGCLESALYGLYLSDNTQRQELWLSRHVDEASKKRVGSEFQIRRVMDHLRSKDAKTQEVAQALYDQTIDYGGHPNERTVTTQVTIEGEGSRSNVTAEYFLCGTLPHLVCLKSTAQVGICCLDIFFNVFRARYQLLGIDDGLKQLRQGL